MKNYSNIQQTDELSLPFGKFKSLPISEIDDLKYLEWVSQQDWVEEYIREAVEDRIETIRFTHI